jgi:triosephosphate isomerase
MRRKIVAGNWKMNLGAKDASTLYKELKGLDSWPASVQMMIFPPALYIQNFAQEADPKILIGAQNFFQKEKGAYTGELSITQMQECGASVLLIGHSERRAYFGEHESFLKEKVDIAIKHKSHIVFCCGEPLDIRVKGQEKEFVKKQLVDSLFHLLDDEILYVTIAYEPVWAIGTGKTASVEQAEDMHALIRSWLIENYSMELANKISILYGGSCSPENAESLFACPNVDGGLIGGASLKAESFLKIAESF